MLKPLLVTAVPLAALAALAGAYPSSTLPLLVAAAAVFIATGTANVGAKATRWLDVSLIAALAAILLQWTPLPGGLLEALSPDSARVRAMLSLAAAPPARSLSIDAGLTRLGFASALAAVLVFWTARDLFARSGVRVASRTLALAGALAALVGLAQRVTSPKLLLWTWKPIDPGALPYGPFVNRNHFATWLLMATALTLGYLASRVRARRLLQQPTWRGRIHDVVADGTAPIIAGCAAATTLGLLSSGSRGALIGACAAVPVAFGLAFRTRIRRSSLGFGMALTILLLSWGALANVDLLAQRFTPGHEVGRTTIWRETLPVVSDFPATGTGIGTYARAMLVYQQTKSELLFNQAHNEYLQLVAEGGLLVTLPVAAAAIAWLSLAWRRLRDDRRERVWMRVGAASGIAGVAVQCVWESPLRMPANAMLFALLAAIVVHQRSDETPRGEWHGSESHRSEFQRGELQHGDAHRAESSTRA